MLKEAAVLSYVARQGSLRSMNFTMSSILAHYLQFSSDSVMEHWFAPPPPSNYGVTEQQCDCKEMTTNWLSKATQ